MDGGDDDDEEHGDGFLTRRHFVLLFPMRALRRGYCLVCTFVFRGFPPENKRRVSRKRGDDDDDDDDGGDGGDDSWGEMALFPPFCHTTTAMHGMSTPSPFPPKRGQCDDGGELKRLMGSDFFFVCKRKHTRKI